MVKNHYLYLPPDIPHATETRSTNTIEFLLSEAPQEVTDWANGKMIQQSVSGENLSIHTVMIDTACDLTVVFKRRRNGIYLFYTFQGEPGYIHGKGNQPVLFKRNQPSLFYAPSGENKIWVRQGKTTCIYFHLKAESIPQHPCTSIILMHYYLGSVHHRFILFKRAVPLPADIIASVRAFNQHDPYLEAWILNSIVAWIGMDEAAGPLPESGKAKVHTLKGFIEVQVRKGTLPHINEMSESLSIHPDTLGRAFKKTFGISLKKFITAQKMEEALRLLTEEFRSAQYVSEKLGYNSPSSFRFQFKLFYGYTPSHMKALIKEVKNDHEGFPPHSNREIN